MCVHRYIMSDFYLGIITSCALIVTGLTTFYLTFIPFYEREYLRISEQYKTLCLKLSHFRQICHSYYYDSNCLNHKTHQAYIKFKKHLISEEQDRAYDLYGAFDELDKKFDEEMYSFAPSISYSFAYLEKVENSINAIWYILSNCQNRDKAFTDRKMESIDGMSKNATQYILNDVSFGNHFDSVDWRILGNIAGHIECDLLPEMKKIKIRMDDRQNIYEHLHKLFNLTGILFVIGVVEPLLALLLRWNCMVIAIICMVLFLCLLVLIVTVLNNLFNHKREVEKNLVEKEL